MESARCVIDFLYRPFWDGEKAGIGLPAEIRVPCTAPGWAPRISTGSGFGTWFFCAALMRFFIRRLISKPSGSNSAGWRPSVSLFQAGCNRAAPRIGDFRNSSRR
jgi:hypothetical protein